MSNASSDQGKPNVLLITADHWSGSLLGAAGHSTIQTPTIDQLARNGMRFTRAYSECPVCIPARRTLMTGTSPRTHGDRVFNETQRMPALPTLASAFTGAGYQAQAVGKLHVYPQRDRIGFDDVQLVEEGRSALGAIDDYDIFLAEQGFAGQQHLHGMNTNEYVNRPWHLPEHCHVTNWTSVQAARMIKRRDPTRPAFWYVSYTHPHPPLVPLSIYLDLYRDLDVDLPVEGAWAMDDSTLPNYLRSIRAQNESATPAQIRAIRRAFYALCTHIDHQIRLIIGTLREEQLLDDTVILLTADHGDMLGDFGLWAKRLFYEKSANIPMILMGTANDDRIGYGKVDNRLVGLQDVMPTLLDLAGIPIPDTVEGQSMIGDSRREFLYGECLEGENASRMLHDGRYKLIWYPAGNHVQLFDLEQDPLETVDRATDPSLEATRTRLEALLASQLYGGDEAHAQGGRLAGTRAADFKPAANRGLTNQRGLHFPPPPVAVS